MTRILRNGALAGLAGGAALAVVLVALGEAAIGAAVGLEERAQPGGGHEEMFTRTTQQVGGVLGALVYGAVVGVVFAVVFAALRHRVPAATDFRRSVVLAGAGWTGTVLVPFLLHPPSPPGVGDPSTVGRRTGVYLLAVGWGVVAVASTLRLASQLRGRGWDEPARSSAGAAFLVGLVVLATLLLPAPPSVRHLPGDLVWSFRLASLAATTACWATLGLAFGALVAGARRRAPVGA